MRISIFYISQTGNTDTAADYIADGILANYPSRLEDDAVRSEAFGAAVAEMAVRLFAK